MILDRGANVQDQALRCLTKIHDRLPSFIDVTQPRGLRSRKVGPDLAHLNVIRIPFWVENREVLPGDTEVEFKRLHRRKEVSPKVFSIGVRENERTQDRQCM